MPLRYQSFLVVFYYAAFILMGHNCYSQISTNDSCFKMYSDIRAQYDSGHYQSMDSLYLLLRNSDCRKDLASYESVLRLVIRERLQNHYRINEVEELQKELNTLLNRRNNNSPTSKGKDSSTSDSENDVWRIGINGSYSNSNIGKAAWGYGLEIVKNFQHKNDVGAWGIGIGVFYQKLPYDFYVVNNRDKNNNYLPNGFVLNTNGYLSNYGAQIKLSRDFLPRSLDMGVGLGFYVGAELIKIKNTFTKNYYYEFNYVDSIAQPGNIHFVRYSSIRNANFFNQELFKEKTFFNILLGANLFVQPGDRILFCISPQYALNTFGKLSVNHPSYSERVRQFILKFSVCYTTYKRKSEARKIISSL